MIYINKGAIVSIELKDEVEIVPEKIIKKGSWKRKPFLFSKGKKWDKNYFLTYYSYRMLSEEELYADRHIVYRDGKLYRLSRIIINLADQSTEYIYFDSDKERDAYVCDFNLFNYIKI